MPQQPASRDVIIRAFLTVARNSGGRAWLVNNLTRATLALAANQPRVKVLGVEGQHTTFEHDMGTDETVACFQQALEQWDREDDNAPFDPAVGGVLLPRLVDVPY